MTMPLRSRKFKIWYLVLHIYVTITGWFGYSRAIIILNYNKHHSSSKFSSLRFVWCFNESNIIILDHLRFVIRAINIHTVFYCSKSFSMSQRTLYLLHIFMPFLENILLHLCAFSCLGILNKEQWPFHGPKNTNL